MKTARNDEVNEDTRTDFIMFRAKFRTLVKLIADINYRFISFLNNNSHYQISDLSNNKSV